MPKLIAFRCIPIFVCAMATWCTQAVAAPAPNIIFILADDLGYGDLGCYGQKVIQTPRLDQMASEGLRFTDAYAGSTVCAPSRSALMTGQHTGHTRVRGNALVPLLPEDVTVAEVLKEAGYETALIGKWGLGEPGTSGTPNRQGFDYFFGYLNQKHAHNHYPTHLWRNEEQVAIPGNDEVVEGVCGQCTTYAQDLLTSEALDYITRPRQKPYFLYLSYIIPHTNNERGAYDGNGMEVPSHAPYEDREWPPQQKGHAAMITRMDGDIGRLLDALKESGADQNTLVIFSSDNGPLNEGGGKAEFFDSNGPLQGFKRSMHDGGIRVPFIAWGAGVPRGATTSAVTAFWDFLPTAAELAGAAAPTGIDGVSIAAVLRGAPAPENRPPLYWEFHEGGFHQALRNGKWKAVRRNRGPIKLFDLSNDIAEERDLAGQEPETAARLTQLFESSRSDSPDFPVRERRN
ncbi:MAG: Arylsulfatase [Candidatus Hydrogenedentota bacterium]|jgi:arylsulfatase A-like enzyme